MKPNNSEISQTQLQNPILQDYENVIKQKIRLIFYSKLTSGKRKTEEFQKTNGRNI